MEKDSSCFSPAESLILDFSNLKIQFGALTLHCVTSTIFPEIMWERYLSVCIVIYVKNKIYAGVKFPHYNWDVVSQMCYWYNPECAFTLHLDSCNNISSYLLYAAWKKKKNPTSKCPKISEKNISLILWTSAYKKLPLSNTQEKQLTQEGNIFPWSF